MILFDLAESVLKGRDIEQMTASQLEHLWDGGYYIVPFKEQTYSVKKLAESLRRNITVLSLEECRGGNIFMGKIIVDYVMDHTFFDIIDFRVQEEANKIEDILQMEMQRFAKSNPNRIS